MEILIAVSALTIGAIIASFIVRTRFSLKLNNAKHAVEASQEKLELSQRTLAELERNLKSKILSGTIFKQKITELESHLAVSNEKHHNLSQNVTALTRQIDESQGMTEELRQENSNQKGLINLNTAVEWWF